MRDGGGGREGEREGEREEEGRRDQRLSLSVQGGKLTKAPSMTLSESQALNSFDFLEEDDAALLHRMSRVSCSEGSEPTFSMSVYNISFRCTHVHYVQCTL